MTFNPYPKPREATLIVAAGMKGIGKTFLTEKQIESHVRGNSFMNAPPRKVLIFDANDEYERVKAIALKDVARFASHPKIEARRIRPFFPDGRRMKIGDMPDALEQVLDNFKGGLLLIEDINKYVSDSMPQDVVGAICTNRHISCDIIMHQQSIGRILPKVWQNLAWVRFHKHLDSVDDSKTKLEGRYQIFRIVELMIEDEFNKGNERFYLHVNILKNKIIGNYTKAMLLAAIDEYLQLYNTKIVKPLANKVDRTGKKMYNFEQAYNKLRNQLYLTYLGN